MEKEVDPKKKELYLKQVELLNTFLEHHAITQAQYDKSFGDLTVLMGMEGVLEEESRKKKSADSYGE